MATVNKFRHYTGALVEVDESGKKKITYDGLDFKSFKAVIEYKKTLQDGEKREHKTVKDYRNAREGELSIKELRDRHLRNKGEG